MKSTRPDGPRRPRRRRDNRGRAAALAVAIAALAAVPACPAIADPPPSVATACAAARDRDLQALDEEALAIATTLDNDAAVADAPDYTLAKTRDALMAEIDRERAAVEARYRDCLAGR